MRTKFKQWAVDYLVEHPEMAIQKIDLENEFFKKPVCLEVGSGKGEFILYFSQKYLDKNFLAIEKCETVAGIMAKKLVEAELKNVLVFPNDAKLAFEQLGENYAEAVYLNFSDPWPKKRHEKRRLTHKAFLDQYYRVLKPEGLLIFKTDNDGLFEYTIEEIKLTQFKVVSIEPDYKFDETNDVMTEYERKFRELGQPIHRIVLRK